MASEGELRDKFKISEMPAFYSSTNLDLDLPDAAKEERPPAIRHVSAPAYSSPLRHHCRTNSGPRRPVKETLNARSEYSNSEDDGTAEHRINQYLIRQEIGRGSFGAVHMAVDQYGQEYAVKEFSKSRLRKRAQSNLLRRPNAVRRAGQSTAGTGFHSPLHARSSTSDANAQDALELIREEIAIMKKLHHPNLVSLFEVLDDPEEDSLYMVMEMCKNGVVMKIGLYERADPYDEEQCRHWFRDMILGLEYLHGQGIIHRDIKPDNCLITEDGVLKIVDFGVSEMFAKDSEMTTVKSAGSPAFMPPELCVAKHGGVSGRAADIWSLGVTLYCLRYGRLPFEKDGMLQLYESIKNDPVVIGEYEDESDWKDLMLRILEKDPEKRITMDELREHPWVTRGGTDKLLSKDENVASIVEPPTEAELNAAITGNMGRILVVMKAVKKFKKLLVRRRPDLMGGIFGRASKIVQPPMQMESSHSRRAQSAETELRRPIESALTTEGIHRDIPVSNLGKREPEEVDNIRTLTETPSGSHSPATRRWTESLKPQHKALNKPPNEDKNESKPGATSPPPEYHPEPGKGHAHNPLEDTLFLDIGTGGEFSDYLAPDDFHVVSESPGATDFNVYERAYQEEIDRILAERKGRPTLYLTRRVEDVRSIREHECITDHSRDAISNAKPGLAHLVERARANFREENPRE